MKQKIYIAALLAGMLALAGCGGGSSTPPDSNPDAKTPLEEANEKIADLEGNDNRSDADKLADKKAICDVEGIKYDEATGKCAVDDTAAKAEAAKADAASLKKALDASDITTGVILAAFLSGGGDELDDDNKTDTPVAALSGWTGAEYKKDKTEVRVYSKTKAGEEGDPINEVFTGLTTPTSTLAIGYSDFENGTLDAIGGVANPDEEQIKITGFTATAGIQQFKNTDGGATKTIARIPGTFYGVSGTYYCTPAANNTCAVQLDGKNQKLGQVVTGPAGSENTNALVELSGGAIGWTFQPASLTAKVSDEDETTVARYGWWLTKPETGDWSVNVFTDGPGATELANTGSVLPGSGTAKYVGGAAGKYAFSSVFANTHEAGHFTAKVTLNAEFGDDTISGKVEDFKGDATGMDTWEVTLGTSRIGDYEMDTSAAGLDDISDANDGTIHGKYANPDSTDDNPLADLDSKTTWKIGDASEAAAGSWSGQLWNLTNGVPTVATGTFEAEYGSAATMIGAFGADKE